MRRYYRHRRAYAPRMWWVVLLACGVAVGITNVLPMSPWLGGIVGGVTGFAVMQGRWMIWRWRHPVVSHDQYIEDMRRAARWN
jgi:hypothetical protein